MPMTCHMYHISFFEPAVFSNPWRLGNMLRSRLFEGTRLPTFGDRYCFASRHRKSYFVAWMQNTSKTIVALLVVVGLPLLLICSTDLG